MIEAIRHNNLKRCSHISIAPFQQNIMLPTNKMIALTLVNHDDYFKHLLTLTPHRKQQSTTIVNSRINIIFLVKQSAIILYEISYRNFLKIS